MITHYYIGLALPHLFPCRTKTGIALFFGSSGKLVGKNSVIKQIN
jgi:hypothetical protein